MRKTQLSVTNFLHCGDEYLFLLRSEGRVDAGKLNGIGGKVEEGEDYLTCAIRETKEETGYDVAPEDIRLSGIVHLYEGYEDDWVMCFFKIEVASKEIPLGNKIPEGELMWLPKQEIFTRGYTLVDDLQYTWEKIVAGKEVFFMNALISDKEKVKQYVLSSLQK